MARRLTKARFKKLLFSFILALLIALVSYLQKQPNAEQSLESVLGQSQAGTYQVVDFSDGDTISVDMDGKKESIRMIGVDTPETHHPSRPVQCFGQAASDFTKHFIGANRVRLEADPTNTNRDRYDRLLRYVYLPDGTLVNAEIIKQGYGFAYTSFPFIKAAEFQALEAEAKTANRGLWGDCTIDTNNGQPSTVPAR